MEERYRTPVSSGLLWNVNQPAMQLVPRKHAELAPLLARRNALAAHLWQERPPAPPMLQVWARAALAPPAWGFFWALVQGSWLWVEGSRVRVTFAHCSRPAL
jgi:hypothetical protein